MNNTKYFICSFLLLFLMGNSLQAQIIVSSGTTYNLGNFNITQSIIVEDGGVLNVTGNPVMGHPNSGPVEIFIKDGGKMTNQGGSISGLAPGKFTGIIVEGTAFNNGNTDLALDLNNFSISNAITAIAILATTPGTNDAINQNISVNRTDIYDCEDLLKNNFGTDAFNRDNSYNPVTFESCTFVDYTYTGSWPIHLHFMNNLTFSNCTIDISGDLNMHFNMQRNCTIIGCEFINTDAAVGAVFHRDNYNIVVKDNVFNGGGFNSSYVGVGPGVIVHSGIFHSGEISNNVFNDCGAGISIGDAAGVSGGNDGDVTGVRIFGNTFNNSRYGIQCSKSTGVTVQKNNFNSCRIGLLFNGADNVGPSVLCNKFTSCRAGIRIDDQTLSQFATFQEGADPHNRFFSCLIDIYNNNGGQFIYNLYQFWYPGRATSTLNVSIGLGPLLQFCKRWLTEEDDQVDVEFDEGSGQRNGVLLENNQNDIFNIQDIFINPNPSLDGLFKLKVSSNFELSTVQVFNNLGQRVFAGQINNNESNLLDLSALPKGIYLLNVKTDKMMKTERIVIQ